MKHFFWALIFALLPYFSAAQVVTVLDFQSSLPLSNVRISGEDKSTSILTDAHGQADLSSLAGEEVLHFYLTGFGSEEFTREALGQQLYVVHLFPGAISLDQVVVVASRWSQDERETPAHVATITPRDIAIQNPQTAADLLGSSGQVFIQKSQQGGGSPMIRGFATNRVLIAVDGVRMNTAIFRSGNVQNVINLDPLAVEQTEVLFGPGSIMYGSDAIGGVMSFHTLTPTMAIGADPLVSGQGLMRVASANNELTTHFDVNVGWKKWAMVSSFSHNRFDDLKQGSYGPTDYLMPYVVQRQDSMDHVLVNDDPRRQIPSAYDQTNLMQKVRFRPNPHWNMVYAFHYSTTSDYGRYDRHSRTRNGLPRYAEWYYGPQEWLMNQVTINHDYKTAAYDHVVVRLAQQHFEESRIDRGLNNDMRSVRIERVGAWSASLDAEKELGASHKLFYGVEAVVNDVHSIGRDISVSTGRQSQGPSRYPQATWNSYAAFLRHQWRVAENVLLVGGVRYNQYQLDAQFDTVFYPLPFTTAAVNDGALTGSVGMVWTPDETWTFSLNGSTGFRAPNVDDMGKVFDSEPGAVVVPNPGLRAEYAYSGDLGIAKVFGKAVKLDVSGFYTLLQHAMVRRDFELDGRDSILYDGEMSKVQAIQNAAQASVYGVQAGVEVKLISGFGCKGRVNYQRGHEVLDDGSTSGLRHAAPLFASTHVTYQVKKLSLDVYGIFNDEVSFTELPQEEQGKTEIYALDDQGRPYAPMWYTLNFKAHYHINETFSLSGGVENITDQRYRPYSSGLSGAGRNVIMALRIQF
jgi:hemoglobin/transferrin/lactoferrin receptor protein